MNKLNVKFLANSALIAALYVALTWALAPISYGSVQFRISEALVLLVVLNPRYAAAIIIGTFISNTTSSLGWYDMVFGTLATALAVIPMIFVRKVKIAALFPVISNAIIVSIELLIVFEIPFWFSFITVGLGEAVVLYLIGVPAIYSIKKNPELTRLMQLDTTVVKGEFNVSIKQITVFILAVIGIIFFFTYPVGNTIIEEEAAFLKIFDLFLDNNYILILNLISIVLYFVFAIFNNKLKYISLIFVLVILACHIYIPFIDFELNIGYYIGYFIFIILLGVTPFIKKN